MDKKEILKKLEIFKPIEKQYFLKIKLPILITSVGCLLQIIIIPKKDGFRIETYYDNDEDEITGDIFIEFNNYDEYYYNLFVKNDSHNHFGIEYGNNRYFKEYSQNYNLNWSLYEFITFFIDLDRFIIENNLN